MSSIYLDHAAATPMRPEVRDTVASLTERLVGNPSSVHRWGREARRILENARERTAACLRVHPDEIRFVRGGTESANLAILGRAALVEDSRERPIAPILLRSTLEHSAVRESMEALAARGFEPRTFRVDDQGRVHFPSAAELARDGVILVSCQWVNQETGMILPIPEIAEPCAEAEVPLHVDAVQAAGRVSMPLDDPPVSLLSLSGHKLGGPRGTGALVVREGVSLKPILFGGGQEKGLRPGTEDVAGAAGFARALELSLESVEPEGARIERLRRVLEETLRDALPDLRVHGGSAPRAPHILGVGVPGIPRDTLPSALDLEGIGASAGSACRSGSAEMSPVLEALYGPEARDVAPLRLSLGWSTTEDEVQEAAGIIPRVVERVLALGVGT